MATKVTSKIHRSPVAFAETAVVANPTPPSRRLRSPPPTQINCSDEDVDDKDDNDNAKIEESMRLMRLALGEEEDEKDAVADYDEEVFEGDGDGDGYKDTVVDENAGSNTPPKVSSRPSSVSRKLQVHMQNARGMGMELIDKGTRGNYSETATRTGTGTDASINDQGSMAVLSDGQHIPHNMYGLDPNISAEALEKMRLLSLGSSPLRGVLRSREANYKTKTENNNTAGNINTEQKQGGMVMLSKGSTMVKGTKVASISASDLKELYDNEIGQGQGEGEDEGFGFVEGEQGVGAGAVNVKRRIKKKSAVGVHF